MAFEDEMISKHFSWAEALYLPQWNRLANASDGLTDQIKSNLSDFFNKKMDMIREYFDAPLIIHCAYRPPAYNALVKGAKNSQHTLGKAADFHVKDFGCDDAQKKIIAENMLEKWSVRMERGTQGWIHIDNFQVDQFQARWFNP